MQIYTWVSSLDSTEIISLLEQARPFIVTEETLDQGRILYTYITKDVADPQIYNYISAIGQVPILLAILESQIRQQFVSLSNQGFFSSEDVAMEDILRGLQRSTHKMVEHLLQTSISKVQIHYQVVDDDRLVLFVPMQESGRIYRSPQEYAWVVGQTSMKDLVGWQPISSDPLYWTILPDQPEIFKVNSGMLLIKVGGRADETLRWIELRARQLRSQGVVVLPTTAEITDSGELASLITLAEVLETQVEIFPEAVRIFVTDRVGFTPLAWIQKNLDRIQKSQSVIAKAYPGIGYKLQDRPKVQIAAELAYKEAFPERETQIYVLPDLSIIYEILSIRDVGTYLPVLHKVLRESRRWTLTTLPAQDAFGMQIASIPDEDGWGLKLSLLVKNHKHYP